MGQRQENRRALAVALGLGGLVVALLLGLVALNALNGSDPSTDEPIEIAAAETQTPISQSGADPGASSTTASGATSVPTRNATKPTMARPTPTAAADLPTGFVPHAEYTAAPGGKSTRTGKPDEDVRARVAVDVEAAYLRYWEVVARANRDLDTSQLASVLLEPELSVVADTILERKRENAPVGIEVRHGVIEVIVDSEQEATVIESYTNSSVRLDPQTKLPLPGEGAYQQLIDATFQMRQVDGVWKVEGSTQIAAFITCLRHSSCPSPRLRGIG